MAQLKPGSRMRSAVCATEVMVVMAPDGDVEVTCGGAPMLDVGGEPPGGLSLSPDASEGTQIGKRYVDEAGDDRAPVHEARRGVARSLAACRAGAEGSAKPLPSSD